VLTAYHETKEPVLYNPDGSKQPHPTWTELKKFMARDEKWDKGFLFGKECVFLSTTRWNGVLPTRGITKRPGSHWRVQVPLERFNDYRIKCCNTNDSQRQYVLCKSEDFKDLRDETDNPDNGCLWRDAENNWYANEYNNADTHYFVSLVVLEEVVLDTNYEWDTLKSQGKIVLDTGLINVK